MFPGSFKHFYKYKMYLNLLRKNVIFRYWTVQILNLDILPYL